MSDNKRYDAGGRRKTLPSSSASAAQTPATATRTAASEAVSFVASPSPHGDNDERTQHKVACLVKTESPSSEEGSLSEEAPWSPPASKPAAKPSASANTTIKASESEAVETPSSEDDTPLFKAEVPEFVPPQEPPHAALLFETKDRQRDIPKAAPPQDSPSFSWTHRKSEDTSAGGNRSAFPLRLPATSATAVTTAILGRRRSTSADTAGTDQRTVPSQAHAAADAPSSQTACREGAGGIGRLMSQCSVREDVVAQSPHDYIATAAAVDDSGLEEALQRLEHENEMLRRQPMITAAVEILRVPLSGGHPQGGDGSEERGGGAAAEVAPSSTTRHFGHRLQSCLSDWRVAVALVILVAGVAIAAMAATGIFGGRTNNAATEIQIDGTGAILSTANPSPHPTRRPLLTSPSGGLLSTQTPALKDAMTSTTRHPPPSPTGASSSRFCKDTSCWDQVGSDLESSSKGDRFGEYLAFSNRARFSVSAPKSSAGGQKSGAVHVYDFNESGDFVRVGKEIVGSEGEEIRGILSKDGARVVIGGPLFDWRGYKNVGKVQVFELQSGSWKALGSPLYGEAEQDRAGHSVALSIDGNTIAFGSPFSHEKKGSVRVYRHEDGEWRKMGSDIVGEGNDERLGWWLAMSDNGEILALGSNANAIRVVQFENGAWSQLGNVINGENPNDDFGKTTSLSSDGKIVAGGAWRNSGNDVESGHVRIFSYNEDIWRQVGMDIDGSGPYDWLNRISLSEDGRFVASGSGAGNNDEGYVYVHENIGGTWYQLGGKITGQKPQENFGAYVALSPDATHILISAPNPQRNSNHQGLIRLFKLWNDH
uniref:Uncharacterized protein n=1 Tax=Pseudictyota dubia TaxID=2749911 RepID=A0A7R9WBQ6_9STRA|mmetsp:Transcript_4322/g.7556  ORF Transcript_4322/g.7556 Transcript_4322/m.7556 type:complete len:824 (+) Transcript_4322:221-2692(+)